MNDPNSEVVKLVTDVLTGYQNNGNQDLPIFMGYVNDEGVHLAYLNCSYNDLRLIAATAEDEATLKMLAFNQSRLQRFIDEATSEDSE